MIVVKLMGGLGNQMFQYAAGKSLASSRQVPLKLDVSFLNDKTPKQDLTFRNYGLSRFNINDEIILPAESSRFQSISGIFANTKIQSMNRRYFQNKLPVPKIIKYQETSFYPGFFKISRNSYLIGYWQSERYFKPYNELIRECFSINDPTTHQMVDATIGENKHASTVSVHVRRGDYATNELIKSVHGLCPISYYTNALEIISKHVSDPIFFIVSDDMDWVVQNFAPIQKDYNIVFVTVRDELHDLLLMQKCMHNIIANSSFSWWGAWLNNNPDRIVISPRKWFVDQSIPTDDLIPKSWIRL